MEKGRKSLGEVLKEVEDRAGYFPLHINKVDGDTYEVFKEIAFDQYKGDYGITLKVILEGYLRYMFVQTLDERVTRLEDIVEDLKPEDKKDNKIVMCDGTVA